MSHMFEATCLHALDGPSPSTLPACPQRTQRVGGRAAGVPALGSLSPQAAGREQAHSPKLHSQAQHLLKGCVPTLVGLVPGGGLRQPCGWHILGVRPQEATLSHCSCLWVCVHTAACSHWPLCQPGAVVAALGHRDPPCTPAGRLSR